MASWPKYDPCTGFWLCENCWNRGNWSHSCQFGICECPKPTCGGREGRVEKVRFTGEGQLKIDTGNDVIRITPKSWPSRE